MESTSEYIERATELQNILISCATGGDRSGENNSEYKRIRKIFIDTECWDVAPAFVKTCRDLHQFWNYIKKISGTYEGRRNHIYEEFSNFLDCVERGGIIIHKICDNENIMDGYSVIKALLKKAERRCANDPDGAITAARSLIEAACKIILKDMGENYEDNGNLIKLYKHVSKKLNISPDQRSEEIIKQILGGCMSVVNGLAGMRNKLGDAHGRAHRVRLTSRHAELAVNMAGSMSIFLIRTHKEKNSK